MSSEVKQETNSTPSDVKKDNVDEEMKDAKDSKIKDGEKDKVKNETKKESVKGSDEDDEDDDDEEEVALLDRPVVMTGCRARKKVERLEMSFSTPKEKQEFPEGKGKKLGDCPRIEAQIQKMKVIDLKPLHKILFNRIGSGNEIKKNIRKFCGFPFDKDSTEYNRKKASLDKSTLPLLKQACSVLDLERSGTKDEIVTRVMTFLMKPEDSGKKVPTSKKKASKEKKKSASKKVKSEKKSKVEKNEDSEEEKEKSDEEEEEEEENSSGGESSMGGTDEECPEADEVDEASDADASDEEPKKKSKDAKTPKAKSKADKGKKEDKKTKGTKRKQGDDDASGSSADDEPPAKKSKMPTNDEISKLVKHILDSADLQEITMKKVIKQVSDAYPDFDLSHKKAFIKSTIKSVIS